ncbi:MAG TPA: hypothetical protein VLI41_15060, partial [Phenylobacterium sp.]|uniref:hypothetical protein n=1 Tax=Phenylobacterium sp. TaxID=1871053 RepID=UPI002CFB8F63
MVPTTPRLVVVSPPAPTVPGAAPGRVAGEPALTVPVLSVSVAPLVGGLAVAAVGAPGVWANAVAASGAA